MLTNGTILAAAGLGFGLPGQAAAERDSPTRLLPSFGHATTLDVADVSRLHGDDQLLLTTLQGSSTGAALGSGDVPHRSLGADAEQAHQVQWVVDLECLVADPVLTQRRHRECGGPEDRTERVSADGRVGGVHRTQSIG
nr:hypothetical protein OG781_03030 [Streptomyces sp. NBC_00830]